MMLLENYIGDKYIVVIAQPFAVNLTGVAAMKTSSK